MGKFIDLSGIQFGKLKVIKRAENRICPNGKLEVRWLCQCECGNITLVNTDNLKRKHTRSCGCLKYETKNYTHKMSKNRLYNIWSNMKARCYNTKDQAFKNYGARGIVIYDDWKNNFIAFRDWSINNGYKENLTIERINVMVIMNLVIVAGYSSQNKIKIQEKPYK